MTKPPWTHEVGTGKTRVIVYVDPDRKNKLTLRWRADGNWKKQSLDRAAVVDRGKLTADDQQFAIGAAMKKSLELSGQVPPAVVAASAASGKPLVISEAEALIIDPKKGKYQHKKPFRDELVRSLRFACVVWGADRAWITIEEGDWTELLRTRLDQLLAKGKKGDRATQITVGGLITTVRWLRRKKHIPRDAAPWPDDWKQEIEDHWKGVTKSAAAPKPHRPRHTLEDAQKILRASTFEPRFYVLLQLGMELRLGQVVRTRRSDVDLTATVGRPFGRVTIHGSGKKGGTVVVLTKGQRAALDEAMSANGYLEELEQRYQRGEIADYALFPAGFMNGRVGNNRGQKIRMTLSDKIDPQKSATAAWVRKQYREAEQRAGVEHVQGRGAYGIRRVSVDVAKGMKLSVHALQAGGGWSDTKTPLTIYADADNEAGQIEAAPFRAHLRGEGADNTAPGPAGTLPAAIHEHHRSVVEAKADGHLSFLDGKPIEANPYDEVDDDDLAAALHRAWAAGWEEGRAESLRIPE